MNNFEPHRTVLWVTLPIAVLLRVSSLGGLFLPLTYSEETRLHAAQYLGNDAENILLIVPLLLSVAFLALRGSPAARLIWIGTLVYLVYDFFRYAFATDFNTMFLAYCAVVGLSSFALAESLLLLPVPEIACRFGPRAPRKTAAAVLLLMGLGMVFHWMGEILPALFAGRGPQAERNNITISIGQTVRLDVSMLVGLVMQSVTVQTSASIMQKCRATHPTQGRP